jgi:hypothetical protein
VKIALRVDIVDQDGWRVANAVAQAVGERTTQPCAGVQGAGHGLRFRHPRSIHPRSAAGAVVGRVSGGRHDPGSAVSDRGSPRDHANSVQSFHINDGDFVEYGPYFTADVKGLYDWISDPANPGGVAFDGQPAESARPGTADTAAP